MIPLPWWVLWMIAPKGRRYGTMWILVLLGDRTETGSGFFWRPLGLFLMPAGDRTGLYHGVGLLAVNRLR